jgi:glycosyltransferase involved in cell wall biosynthesis
MERRLRDWAARYGDRARIVTGVPHDDVPAYLNAMDILCAPSQTTPRWREQLGRMLIEAFACGVPVVGTNHGGIAELVEPGVDGLLVPPGDPAALASALGAILSDPAAGRRLGEAGREKVARAFTPAVHLAGLHSLYHEAIDRLAHTRGAA